jgi:hypothetical protein
VLSSLNDSIPVNNIKLVFLELTESVLMSKYLIIRALLADIFVNKLNVLGDLVIIVVSNVADVRYYTYTN